MKSNWTGGLVAAAIMVFMSIASASERAQDKLVIAAIAMDVRTVVVRDDAGRFTPYVCGDVVADSDWQVYSVGRDSVSFVLRQSLAGSRMEMRLQVGDEFAFRVPLQPRVPHALTMTKVSAETKPQGKR